MTAPLFDLSRARNILVVKLDELGDFILSTAFLRGLRTSAPQARVLLAVRPVVADLAVTCPYVDGVVTPLPKEDGGFDFRGVTPGGLALFADAFRAGFDLTVVPRYDFDRHGAVTLAANSRARAVIGFAENATPWKAEANAGFDRAFTRVLTTPPGRHEVEQSLALLEFIGGRPAGSALELWPTAEDRAEAERLMAPLMAPIGPFLAVAPGAASPRRTYPADRLAAVVAEVARSRGLAVAMIGTAAERAAAGIIAAALPGRVADLTGRTAPRVAASVIGRAAALVAMDSAPAHMAAAMGVPVLAFSCHPLGGDPNHYHAPERFRPWSDRAAVLRPAAAVPPCAGACAAAEPHCIAAIPPDEAVGALLRLLSVHENANGPEVRQ